MAPPPLSDTELRLAIDNAVMRLHHTRAQAQAAFDMWDDAIERNNPDREELWKMYVIMEAVRVGAWHELEAAKAAWLERVN